MWLSKISKTIKRDFMTLQKDYPFPFKTNAHCIVCPLTSFQIKFHSKHVVNYIKWNYLSHHKMQNATTPTHRQQPMKQPPPTDHAHCSHCPYNLARVHSCQIKTTLSQTAIDFSIYDYYNFILNFSKSISSKKVG